MDTNLLYAPIGAPVLLAVIAWIVVYSRAQHQKSLRQVSIRSQQEPRSENHPRRGSDFPIERRFRRGSVGRHLVTPDTPAAARPAEGVRRAGSVPG